MKIFVVFNEDREPYAYFASFENALTYVEHSREYAQAVRDWEAQHGDGGPEFICPPHLPEGYYPQGPLAIRESKLRD